MSELLTLVVPAVQWCLSRKRLVPTVRIAPSEVCNILDFSIACQGHGDSGIVPGAYWIEYAKPTSAEYNASIRARLLRQGAIEINRENKEYKPGSRPYVERLPVDLHALPIKGIVVFDGSLEKKWKMSRRDLKQLNRELQGLSRTGHG